MLELLGRVGDVDHLVTGMLFFPLGLVFGSFTTVIRHRLPLRRSIVGPRSQCHECRHPLGPGDLIPVVSYLFLRGRCRYCGTAIPARYIVFELAAGVLAAAGGLIAGGVGGVVALALWAFLVAVHTLRFSRQLAKENSGVTLVEILIAVALLVGAAVPMLQLSLQLRGGTPWLRQMAMSVAMSKLEKLGSESNYNGFPSSSVNPETKSFGPYRLSVSWQIAELHSSDPDKDRLRAATVTVTCDSTCKRPMPAVRVVGYLAYLGP